MKSLLILIFLSISFSSFAKIPLPTNNLVLSFERGTSFSPVPSKIFITLNDNAELNFTRLIKGKEEKKIIGKVDQKTFLEIKAKVETYSMTDLLVDQNPNQGFCMDAPLSFVSVFINGIEKNIQNVIACHTSKVMNSNTDLLVDFMNKVESQVR